MRHPAAAASAVLLLLAGCSKKSSDDDGPPPITVTIGTTPAPADILVGGSVTFTASAAYGTAPYTYLWTFPGGTPASSTEQNPGTVAFNAAGANLVTLQVTDTTGRPGSSSVIVNVYKILQSISLTPATADLKQAATLDFTVTATFTDASTLDVTASSLITSGDTTRIRMTDNRALGLVGPTLATVTITAGYTHGVAGNSGTDNSAVTLLDPDVLWTKAQIQAQWNSFKAVETLASYNTGHVPNMRVDGIPGDEGELKPQMITDGINRANMYRYLAGLPYAVSQDAGNTVRCQKGAHVLTMLRLQGLTVANPHSPPLPVGATLNYQTFIYTDGAAACGESNIMMGWFSGTDAAYVPLLTECVDGWMDDGGVSTLGHRRWILHPELQTTALGMVWAYRSLDGRTYFSALMHVFDTDNPTPS